MLNFVTAPRFLRTDLDSSEVLSLVHVEESQGNVITSTYSDLDGFQSPELPYFVQITTGPNAGDDFVGLYTLDGDQVQLGNGWTWEIVTTAPACLVEQIAAIWATGTSTVTQGVQ